MAVVVVLNPTPRATQRGDGDAGHPGIGGSEGLETEHGDRL